MADVVHCLDTWQHYLLGTKFVVMTDNVANTYVTAQKMLTPKQARWQEFLEEFLFSGHIDRASKIKWRML